jgi:hypothetical protein
LFHLTLNNDVYDGNTFYMQRLGQLLISIGISA